MSRVFQYVKSKPHYVVGGVAYCASLYVMSTYLVGMTICIGPSMEPTIATSGELAFYEIFPYLTKIKKFQRGDIVISICPYDKSKTICKRVLATEGDIVLNYLKYPRVGVIKVPPDHVWLAGDNPPNSTDSRHYGPVDINLLRGRVALKQEKLFHFAKVIPTEFESSDRHSAVLLNAVDDDSKREKLFSLLPSEQRRNLKLVLSSLEPDYQCDECDDIALTIDDSLEANIVDRKEELESEISKQLEHLETSEDKAVDANE